jgi:hypothetical protein
MGCLLSDGGKPSRLRQIVGSIIALIICGLGMALICWDAVKEGFH